jgi:hypothetical protein
LGVSQPLGINDKLREALREAQQILDEAKLTGKIVLTPTTGDGPGSVSSVESSMDRTAKDAKEAAEKSISGGGDSASASVLGGPNDKLLTALDKLIKALEGSSSGGGRGSRKRQAAPGEPPPDAEDGPGSPGYVNPYILQGLIQNPVGTTQNSIIGMLMGGAGMGIKAPSWLGSVLGGTSGFQPGAALASETGLFAAGEAGTFASAGLIAATKVAIPVATFAKTMAIQNTHAKDRLQDATDYIQDKRWGAGIGMDWRGGAWENKWNSRPDIWQKDVREVMDASGLGFQGMRSHLGDKGIVSTVNSAVESGISMGISSSQVGGLLGAGVRSGTFSIQGKDATEQMTSYLARIEGWTAKTAAFGFSSNEALQKLSEISQRGMQGTHILTTGARDSLLSMDYRVRDRLPATLQHSVGDATMAALNAAPHGETQTALMMNQYLGADGNLNAEGEATALKAFGPELLGKMKAQWGSMAGTAIANQLTKTSLGVSRARVMLYQGMKRSGASGAQAMLALNGGDFLDAALASDASEDPRMLREARLEGRSAIASERGGTDYHMEAELAQFGQVVKRVSAMTSDTAIFFQKAGLAAHSATKELLEFADNLRQLKQEAWSNPVMWLLNPAGALASRVLNR